MIQHKQQGDKSYSLMVIILDRGKGSRVLELACQMGACDASCVLGKGTIKNKFLQMIAMDEAEKEIILIVVPSQREVEILNFLNGKFHFERPGHGIAFTMPLAGLLKIKKDETVGWKTSDLSERARSEYTAVFLLTGKGIAEKAVQISQDAGYFGGTIIKAHGSADKSNLIFHMSVEPEKEAALLLMSSDRADDLADLLHERLGLGGDVKGTLVKIAISRVVGLFRDSTESREAGK